MTLSELFYFYAIIKYLLTFVFFIRSKICHTWTQNCRFKNCKSFRNLATIGWISLNNWICPALLWYFGSGEKANQSQSQQIWSWTYSSHYIKITKWSLYSFERKKKSMNCLQTYYSRRHKYFDKTICFIFFVWFTYLSDIIDFFIYWRAM